MALGLSPALTLRRVVLPQALPQIGEAEMGAALGRQQDRAVGGEGHGSVGIAPGP